jgi:iron complex outermembrane receptor protein
MIKAVLFALTILNIAAFGNGRALPGPADTSKSKDSVVALDKIVVQGERIKELSAAPISTERILTENPEVTLIRRGASAGEPVVRGSSGNDISVTLDGAHLQCACTDHMDPVSSYIEDNDIAGVTVETGGHALALGGPALGLVDIKLNKAVLGNAGLQWKIGGQGSTIDKGINGNARVTYSSERFGLDVAGSGKDVGDYAAAGGEKIPYSGVKAKNLLAGVIFKPSENWEISGTYLYDRFWDAGYPALPMDVGFSQTQHGAIGFKNTSLDNLTWSGLLYANATSHAMDDTHRPFVPMHMDMPGSGTTTGAWSLLDFTKNENLFHLRLDWRQSIQSASMTMYDYPNPVMYLETWPKTATSGLKAALTGELPIQDKLRLETGVIIESRSINLQSDIGRRQESVIQLGAPYERSFTLPGLSVGLRYAQTCENEIGVSAAFSSRPPAMSELYGYYLFNALTNRDYIGNARLNPENIGQTEVSGKFTWGDFKAKGALWGLVKKDAIVAIDEPDFPPMSYGAYGVRQWHNGDLEKRAGSEVEIEYAVLDNLELQSVNHVDHAWVSSDNKEPITAESGGTLLVIVKTKPVTIAPELQWAPPQKRYDALTEFTRAPGYAVTNLRFKGKIWLGRQIFWRAGIENVFDQQWNSALDWERFDTHTQLYRPGRSFYVGFEVN